MTRPSHTASFAKRNSSFKTTEQARRNRTRRALGQKPHGPPRNSSGERLVRNLLLPINKPATSSRATRRTTLALARIARNLNEQARARTAEAKRLATAPAREAAALRAKARTAARKNAAAAKREAKRAIREALAATRTANAARLKAIAEEKVANVELEEEDDPEMRALENALARM